MLCEDRFGDGIVVEMSLGSLIKCLVGEACRWLNLKLLRLLSYRS